jgi:hypothetical protein
LSQGKNKKAKEQYRVEISNRFSALENAVVESIRENIKISAKDTIGYYD